MAKFKVGDRVTCDGWENTGGNGYLITAIEGDCYRIAESTDDTPVNSYDYYFDVWDEQLELVSQTRFSPVVEKIVKSIEPGVYGRIKICSESPKQGFVTIDLTNQLGYAADCGMYLNADELESAAKTFMELAKYLREKE